MSYGKNSLFQMNIRIQNMTTCVLQVWCVKLWDEFSSNLSRESFGYTSDCSRNTLHSVLKHIIETDNPINNYINDEKQLMKLMDLIEMMLCLMMKVKY
jgi:hypothetical protein